MNSEKIAANAQKYYRQLVEDYPPARADADYRGKDEWVWLSHACWLAQHIPCLLLEGKNDKAERWQSCLHGYLNSFGFNSIKDHQLDSMPEGEIYRRDG